MHSYYGKEGIWGTQAKQASWLVQRILKAHKHLQAAGYSEHTMIQMEHYSIKNVYGKIRGDMGKVEWRKLVWANYGALNGFSYYIWH